MKKSLWAGLAFLLVGLVIGYAVFGYVEIGHSKEYIGIERVLGLEKGNVFNQIANSVLDLANIRVKILLSGVGGFLTGFFLIPAIKKR